MEQQPRHHGTPQDTSTDNQPRLSHERSPSLVEALAALPEVVLSSFSCSLLQLAFVLFMLMF